MSILGIPILSFLGCPARTRDHFNQAVETIKFCRELQYRVDYSDPAQVERLEEVLSKAEQALKNAISAPTDLALFLDFRNTVKEKYSKDQSEILQGFDNRWIEAEKQDGRKNRIFKKGSRSGEREMLISFVNPGVKTFNFANVPEKSKTTVIVRCRRTDTIEGLLWLFTRERSTHRADIGSSLKMLYFSHFYESEALQKLDESPVKRATVTHVDPIGPSLPQDRCRLLRLLWDRGPSFHFEVASSNSSKISYGNIWRLGDYNDSAFVLKELQSGRLSLSTSIVRQFKPKTKFHVQNLAGGHDAVTQFKGRVHQDFVSGFFERVLEDEGDPAKPYWKLETARVPPPSPTQPVALGRTAKPETSSHEGGSAPIYNGDMSVCAQSRSEFPFPSVEKLGSSAPSGFKPISGMPSRDAFSQTPLQQKSAVAPRLPELIIMPPPSGDLLPNPEPNITRQESNESFRSAQEDPVTPDRSETEVHVQAHSFAATEDSAALFSGPTASPAQPPPLLPEIIAPSDAHFHQQTLVEDFARNETSVGGLRQQVIQSSRRTSTPVHSEPCLNEQSNVPGVAPTFSDTNQDSTASTRELANGNGPTPNAGQNNQRSSTVENRHPLSNSAVPIPNSAHTMPNQVGESSWDDEWLLLDGEDDGAKEMNPLARAKDRFKKVLTGWL